MTLPDLSASRLAHDVLRSGGSPLDPIFSPRSVAVIGATERPHSVGRTILTNLLNHQFGGTVYPINPNRPSVLGIKTWPSIQAVSDRVDLAMIVTPAHTVPGLVAECVEAGVGGAVIITAGFRETGAEGLEREHHIRDQARRGRMRIVGPNCLGVMNPWSGLNATFADTMARPGNMGFLSQSGALCTAVLDWSFQAGVGFSAFVSVGSMLDVGWGELITHLGDDPHTSSILLYMESIGDARSFLSAAREVALAKPIIVLKAGRNPASSQAAASHTGSLTGGDDVLDAAFRRCGVLRVNRISELFSMAEVLAKQPRPRGPRLAILTNAGGPGVVATDALIAGGGELSPLADETMAVLDRLLPRPWSHHNPIDILGDADPERYDETLNVEARAPDTDGLLVILTPQAMTNPTQTAERLKNYAKIPGKPVLGCWMGGAGIAAGEAILRQAGIPMFAYPDEAAEAFNAMWRYTHNLQGLYETPTLAVDAEDVPGREHVTEMVATARAAGRLILTEAESKQILALYGLPTLPTRVAVTEQEAVEVARQSGFPVVLKLHSATITHKSDVGGVRLNLLDADAVSRAYHAIEESVRERAGEGHFQGVTVQPMIPADGYELIVGSSIDSQFGPVLLFGAGGQLVEVFCDRSVALPPLNTTLARRLMERTRIFKAFRGIRGREPVDLPALEQFLVRFGQLVVEQRGIKEIDINPLVAAPGRIIALDARVILHAPEIIEDRLPGLAIRPYPTRYVSLLTLENGLSITLRPIRPEDEPLMVRFHAGLSDESVHSRYFHAMKLGHRVAHERLTRICFIDYDREMALVAVRTDQATGEHAIQAVGRLSKLHGRPEAEFALIVSDRYQGAGLGTELLRRLIQIGRDEGLLRITASILPENRAMQRLCEKLGFRLRHDDREGVVEAWIELGGDPP
jgi:acetyltransferase